MGGDCSSFAYYTTDGTKVPPPQWDNGGCLPGSVFQVAFTGQHIYTLEDSAEGRWLVRRDFASGEEQAISVGAETWRLDATADGTLAIGSREIYVGHFDGNLTEQTVVPPSFHDFALAELGDFGPGATLGSGQKQLPCTPLDVQSPSPQGLPEMVELRRHKLFTLAATCDMQSLAEIAVTDGTAFTFGGESDPLRSWIRTARNGFDVMSWMARILESTPAVDLQGAYAWPAVHATNSEADWQALAGIMTAAEFEQYYSIRDSGYLGLRVGIDPDGRWAYVVAGD